MVPLPSFLKPEMLVDSFHAVVLAKLEPMQIGFAYHLDRHIVFMAERMFRGSEGWNHDG